MPSENPDKDAFGRHVYKLMLAKGLNQSELARLAGLERNRISAYVRGLALPTGLSLTKLAKALGVDPNDLLPDARLSDSPPPVSVIFSPDHSKVRITVDTWLPTAIGTEIIKQIGEHAIVDRE
uniref:Helix-turn-helix domain-containing protein n=1 Tax=Agrobacterium albertimagni TaxID=147266 RepID=A0A7C1NX76_9HYPH